MDVRAGTVPSARGVAPSASVSSGDTASNINNNSKSAIRGFATLDKQQSMGAVKPTIGADTGAAAARSPVVKAAGDATPGRRTLTLSSSDHEGRPQQIVVLEASITSDATINSSERSSLCSASDDDGEDDDDDVLDDEYGAHSLLLDEIAECDDATPRSAPGGSDGTGVDGLLVKPMNKRLPVCPVDDLAVEEEKRLRRSRQQQQQQSAKGGKQSSAPTKKRSCGDTDSLPTPHSTFTLPSRNEGNGRSNSAGDIASTALSTAPLGPPPAQLMVFARRNSSPGETLISRSSSTASLSSPRVATGGPTGGTLPTVTPLLRKDSMAIRRQYWSQLGFSLSRSDLEKSTGRTRVRREGLRVRLNDAKSDRGDVSSFFQFIRSWYGSRDASDDKSDANLDKSDSTSSSGRAKGQRRSALARMSASRSRASSIKRGVQFHEEAELFYIPLHSDYSKRQRDCMWPTRSEFISMVERNLDEVYEEMEREYEGQLAAEEREIEEMRREEQRQRAVEKAAAKEAAQRQKREAEERAAKQAAHAAAIAAMTSPLLGGNASRSPPGSTSGALAIPTLTLTQTEVKVVPRARSSHEIRFKYLRHLGINS